MPDESASRMCPRCLNLAPDGHTMSCRQLTLLDRQIAELAASATRATPHFPVNPWGLIDLACQIAERRDIRDAPINYDEALSAVRVFLEAGWRPVPGGHSTTSNTIQVDPDRFTAPWRTT